MAFIVQEDQYSCSPIAISNVLKYFKIKNLGINDIDDSLWFLRRMCQTDINGSPTPAIEATLNYLGTLYGFSVEYKTFETYLDIKLNSKKECIILNVGLNKDTAHTTLLIKERGVIKAVNYELGVEKTVMHDYALAEMIADSLDLNYKPEGYFLTFWGDDC